ncbi:aspartate/ornithine carbamoyltransferase family protein [Fundidesulfovibrio agrisoli]|uniref:aspartate/ornithine carbamoyltransferase family protein n=1 Tax=Fundidesulfovibrio agrisoli TaxID=2922717 RepID=UPI001FAB9E38|nr:hypothetical protein [Fundidesulfovibrio agrisoli]
MSASSMLRHFFSIADLRKEEIEDMLDRAARLCSVGPMGTEMAGKVVGLCFFQESTRTRVGFDAAVKRLGGSTVIVTEAREVQRAPSPESLEDTIRAVSGYCDMIVMRHAETPALHAAMRASVAPVINAGCGCEHHPTQALLDLFHIKNRFGRLEGLRIGLVGDLCTSRAARSLLQTMRHWPPAELRLMAPPGREATGEALLHVAKSSVSVYPELIAADLDVLYVAGMPNPESEPCFSLELRKRFTVYRETLEALPSHGIIMCPLPRIDEIAVDVDQSRHATYFEQSDNALWARMAALLFQYGRCKQ